MERCVTTSSATAVEATISAAMVLQLVDRDGESLWTKWFTSMLTSRIANGNMIDAIATRPKAR